MIDVGRLGEMMRRNYVTQETGGKSRVAQTMLNNEPTTGSENVVQKRKRKKKIVSSFEKGRDGAARNSGKTKGELFEGTGGLTAAGPHWG